MNTDNFLAKLAEVLQTDPSAVNAEFRLTPEIWDSVAVLATIALIDEEFCVTVPSKELNACPSVGALMQLIQRSVAAHSASAA